MVEARIKMNPNKVMYSVESRNDTLRFPRGYYQLFASTLLLPLMYSFDLIHLVPPNTLMNSTFLFRNLIDSLFFDFLTNSGFNSLVFFFGNSFSHFTIGRISTKDIGIEKGHSD